MKQIYIQACFFYAHRGINFQSNHETWILNVNDKVFQRLYELSRILNLCFQQLLRCIFQVQGTHKKVNMPMIHDIK